MYIFVDTSIKENVNEITVHFQVPSDMTPDEAIKTIDDLVQLADNNENIKILSHEHSVYSIYQYSDLADTIK
jgi:hypothetical protein